MELIVISTVSTSNSSNTTTYTYDLNGNRIGKDVPGGSTNDVMYIYDKDNRLIEAQINSSTVFTAAYDARTRRLAKTEGADTTLYRYDGGTNIQEMDDAGNLLNELIRAGGLGGGIGSVIYSDKSMAPTPGDVEHFVYNPVGHTVVITDDNGDVTQRSLYEAFGQTITKTGSSDNNRLANTKERDESINLDNHGFRYYDPETGSYITRDWIGYADSMNVYQHVGNNPINGVDPLGLAGDPPKDSFEATNGALWDGFVGPVLTGLAWAAHGIWDATLGNPGYHEVTREGSVQDTANHESAAIDKQVQDFYLGSDPGADQLGIAHTTNVALQLALIKQAFQARQIAPSAVAAGEVGEAAGAARGVGAASASRGTAAAEAAENGAVGRGVMPEGPGKYGNLPDPRNVGSGKDFTPATKRMILEQNRKNNGGAIRSDQSGVEAVSPQKSQKGIIPSPNEAQIDHVTPKSKGGTNSPRNAQVLTREENRAKSNN